MGPGLARQESAGRDFGRVWNRTDPFLRSKPGPLAGYLDPLVTLVQAPAVGDVFCICCQMLGSLILLTEAPAEGVFCFLVGSFLHVGFGSLTYVRRLTIRL